MILSGGVGSRLWPLSREASPKPFIKLPDGESLLQKTYERAATLALNSCEIITVTNRELFFRTKDEFEKINLKEPGKNKQNTFILEPVGRNSAAAIATAAHYALDEYGPGCLVLVMPADHLVEDMEAFKQAVDQAEELASKGKMVTFGVKPRSPETGYGYILAYGTRVEKFVEKPDLKTAEDYLASGRYLWNSGMFCMGAGRFLEELSTFAPEIGEKVSQALKKAKKSVGKDWQHYEIRTKDFAPIPSLSVDYAVFEKSKKVAVIPCDMGWSDLGLWPDLGALYPSDKQQNHVVGETLCENTHHCVIHGGERLIATLGIKNLIVADTEDALLIAHRDQAQDIRSLVDKLKSQNNAKYKEFPTVHRPWGTYRTLKEGPGFKLKSIEVKPKGRLSLQSHKKRSEHWVVVSGRALVTN